MSHTPRVMNLEWILKNLVRPLSRAGLKTDQIEQLLKVKGALERWVASIPEHIAAAEAAIAEQKAAELAAQEERKAALREALLIEDLDAPIEDLDLTVRAYNNLKRMGIHTVRELLRPGRTAEETKLASGLRGGRPEQSLYQRLVDGGIALEKLPSWIPRPSD